MNILKYLILILLLWGIPSFFSYDVSIGSKFSLLTYFLLLLYYLLSPKNKILLPFIVLGLLYFSISALSYVNDSIAFVIDLFKYIILIIAGGEVVRQTTIKDFYLLLMLGACSILIHAIFFQDGFGRYSGLYLNPNGAGFVCIVGYCLSFDIENKKIKILGQFIFTLAGIITFSRTFLFLWLIVSILSVLSNRKNALNFGLGIGAMIIAFSFATFLRLNTVRFEAIENLVNSNQTSSANSVLREDSRIDTWSQYYDIFINHPLLGSGYQVLSGLDQTKQGVHNTFLMVLGEAGLIPFLIIIGLYLYMFKKSVSYFNYEIHKILLSIVLIAILMSMHNYFDNYFILFTTMWLYANIVHKKSQVQQV